MKAIALVFKVFFLLMVVGVASAAELAVTVLQKGSGDPIADASVLLINGGESETTDERGRARFAAASASEQVKVLAVGYETWQQPLAAGNTSLTVYLEPLAVEGEALVVVEERVQQKSSKVALSAQELKRAPGTGGDPVAVVASLPGVVVPTSPGGGESGAGFYIRGSDRGESLVWVDRTPIAYLYHMGGLYSTLQPELLQDFNAFLGGFQVEYPDVLGGMLDVKLRSPERDRLHQKYSVGTYLSSFLLEGPIGEAGSRHGFFIGARRSYIDAVFTPDDLSSLIKDDDRPDDLQVKIIQVPVFEDLQAGWEYRTEQDKLTLRYFYASDEIKVLNNRNKLIDPQSAGEIGVRAGFKSANFNWERRWSENVNHVMPVTILSTENSFHIGTDVNGKPYYLKISEDALFVQPEVRIAQGKNLLSVGGAGWYSRTPVSANIVRQPGEEDIGQIDFGSRDVYGLDSVFRAGIVAPYIKYRYHWNDKLVTTVGGKYSYVRITGGMAFERVLPRINAEYEVIENTWLLGSWGQYVQVPQGNEFASGAGNPRLGYEEAEHRIVGIKHKPSSVWTLQLELFDKPMDKLVTFVNGKLPPDNYQNLGYGYARGVDVLIKRDLQNRRTGWLAYSYLEARRAGADGVLRKFSGDQPHTLTAMWSQGLSGDWKKWDLGFRFQYHTGQPYDPVLGTTTDGNGRTVPIYPSKKNAARLPDYWQLDMRLDRAFLYNTWKMNFYVDILNVLNRANVTGYDYGSEWERVNDPIEQTGAPLFPTFGIEAEF
ncbi:MAG: TonB-dependent receptor plug domain-containing protein [Gammaproteobacteria bacterium]|nr:TonB-dependent receptor plug domain-containing protein [Gammaproteobacteria bacterium]